MTSVVRPRPWVILSNEKHPFHGEEYLAATLTTTKRKEVVEIKKEHWIEGNAPKKSYVAPWVIITLKHGDIQEKIGKLKPGFLEKVVEDLKSYISRKKE
ncbi:hypothetical protein AKJ38_04040 [candidate division MSBL1 archaeon SCGC-AAA259I14]|uniref:Uncharacterized protein n=1 Tax=candidate division MSBL1 archaeon SCGC-AAA259I14 TaxID=1698268 RepID=A0A133UPF5_9EURY|nr:hypothetical protein AKJ38_04040 [candidate division MSBL1 archaeon SCGC-AAA259I14]